MSQFWWTADIVKVTGFAGLMFLVWIITLVFMGRFLIATRKTVADTLETMADLHRREFDLLVQQHKDDFSVLNKFADGIQLLGGQQIVMNGKIEGNRSCPVVREYTNPHFVPKQG